MAPRCCLRLDANCLGEHGHCPKNTALACREEAIRTGFLLSQGGEFAFVLLSLAKELKVLPDELNRLLIIVVVLSMALTPFLTELGKTVADASAAKNPQGHGHGASTVVSSNAPPHLHTFYIIARSSWSCTARSVPSCTMTSLQAT